MTHIDLFSGIGGFALAAQWAGFKTIAFVEIEPYAQEVIKANFGAITPDSIRAGRCKLRGAESAQPEQSALECDSPILISDIRRMWGYPFRGATLLTGGFPCQPFSQAGKRRGKEDNRYLWPEMLRVIHEARPAWVLGENVAGIITMELDRVLSDLEGEGYAVQSLVIPACSVDAKHRRDRVWIVAHDASARSAHNCEVYARSELTGRNAFSGSSGILADSEDGGQSMRGRTSGNGRHALRSDLQAEEWAGSSWLPEPDVGGTFDGFSCWLDGIGGKINGKGSDICGDQILCSLWDRILPQAIQWAVRGYVSISPEGILLAVLCKLKKRTVDEAWLLMAGKEAFEKELRGLPYDRAAHCPSCRSGQIQQHAGEYPDALQILSRLLAQHGEKAWTAYRRSDAAPLLGWETGYSRIAVGVKKRVDRLIGLGNAIVPQVAFEIIKGIAEIERGSQP